MPGVYNRLPTVGASVESNTNSGKQKPRENLAVGKIKLAPVRRHHGY